MKKVNLRTNKSKYLKVAIFLSLLAAWVSIPVVTGIVKADSTPVIVIRTANLASPTGSINPHGLATWQLYQSGNREIEVESEDMPFSQGTVLTAFVDGNNIGTFAVDDRNKAKLKLRTENGQQVPVVNDGMSVVVMNGVNVVVQGVFGNGSGTPTPTTSPTGTPSGSPTGTATVSPTGTPSVSPTGTPSVSPTGTPSGTPSGSPTASPSVSPTSSPSPSGTPDNNIYAILNGATINGTLPRGFAEYEIHSSRTELEVRLYQINLAAGTSLGVVANNIAVGNLILESGGQGRLRLRSDHGDTVPVITGGMPIEIKNGATTIMTGTFTNPTGPSPSPSPTGTPQGRFFEGKMTRPGTTSTYYVPKGELKVVLSADESQATISGEYSRLTSAQTSMTITVAVGSAVNTIHDFGTLGGTERHFGPVTINVTPQQVQQLRMSMWVGTVGTVNNPAVEITGAIRPDSSSSDFNGDGSDDLSVFRPGTGTFFIESAGGYTTQVLGNAADKIVSGDYDGDGKTDAAVYRNVNGSGVWEIARSSDGGITSVQFGLATDTTVRGDFDGDGRKDLALFRSSTGVWYINKSNGTGWITEQYGLAGDIPIGADFDGDGRDDIAVFRPSNGIWYWINSSDRTTRAEQFGLAGDVPVAGDFDGDGTADVSVFRPSTGVWYIWHSSDQSFDIRQFGLNGDIPVAGRYDADAKTDIAVFRPSTGVWYIWRSSDNGYDYRNFGVNGDIPLIAR